MKPRLYWMSCLAGASLSAWAASAPTPPQGRTWVPLTATLQTATPAAEPPQVAVTQPDAFHRIITVNLPGFWRESRTLQGTDYDALAVESWTVAQEPGQPAVPLYCVMLEIPEGVTPGVSMAACEEVSVPGLVIPPAQPPPPDVYPEPPAPPFAMDAALYAADDFFPAQNLFSQTVVDLREKRLLVLQLSPFRWNPQTHEARVAAHLEVAVDFQPQPTLQAQADRLATDAASGTLKHYMVLMDDQFEGNGTLSQFVDWKKRKGYRVTVVKTSHINPSGAPNNTEIVNYMRNLAATNYPHYLLILGDHTETNGVAGKYFNTDTTSYYGYTDLDIACRTGTDNLPDLYYGRLFATNSAQASNLLTKVLSMDRTPPTSAMYQKVCVAGQIQDSDNHNNQADRLFCETADLVASYFEQNAGGVSYGCTRAIVNPDGVTATCKWNSSSILWYGTNQIGTRVFNQFVSVATAQSRIITNVNQGIALLQHRDHGYVDGYGWADPALYPSHVAGMTNGQNRPAVFSINCNSGMYNMYYANSPNNSFVRQWLTHNNGGTYAFFGPVDTSYSWYNDWLTHGFYAAFLTNYISFQNTCATPSWPKKLPSPGGSYGAAGKAWRLGEILNFGKMYMYEKFYPDDDTFRLFHLFGDPEAELRLKTPRTLSASHPVYVTPNVSTNVTITLSEAGCDVCLYSPASSIHLVQPNAGLTASFPLSAANSSVIYVTATKQDCRPYEGSILTFAGGSDPFWFRAIALSNSVLLRWENPNNSGIPSQLVHIRAGTSAYPSTTSEGSLVYEGSSQSFQHTGLTPGQTYYYTIWVSQDGSTFIPPP